jgi:hypothetical protein
LFDGTRWIADEGELDGFSGFSPGREDGGGAGEGADLEPVLAIFIALVGCLADDDPVVAIFRGKDGNKRVIAEKRGVVAGGEFEFLGIENGDIGVEHDSSQAHGFDFHGEALAFFEGADVVVFVFAGGDAFDGPVEFDALGLVEGGVGLGLGDVRKLTDPE